MHDDRVFSSNPHDWDTIEDLNMTYAGYYDLPDFYIKLRDNLLSESEQEFFIDGMFIRAMPRERPADVFMKYESRRETDPVARQWKTMDELFMRAQPEKYKWMPRKGFEPRKSYIPRADAEINELKDTISRRIMLLLEDEMPVTMDKLHDCYITAICNSDEIEERINFDKFISGPNFASNTQNWRYATKIQRIIKNPHLKELLAGRLNGKLYEYRRRAASQWNSDYMEYKRNLTGRDNYQLSVNSFFQDIDAGRSIDHRYEYTIARADLFNPMSGMNINRLIKAVFDLNTPLTIYENLTIDNIYRVVFGYPANGSELHLADSKTIMPNDSVYSVADRAFAHIADWQRDLTTAARMARNK
jgi:hypothetical protein